MRRRPEGNGRPLAEDQRFGLPRHWVKEIQETAREDSGPLVAELVSEALDAFAGEDFEVAGDLAGRAKVLAPHSPRIMELLGLSLYHQGEWKVALKELLVYRRLTSATDQNHVIADCYRAQGRSDRALEICAEVAKDSTEPETWAETMIVAAGALADLGDLRGAIAMINRAELAADTVEPYHLRLWYVQADLLGRAGRTEEATRLWSRIVAEDPEFFDAEERLNRASRTS